MTKKKPNKKNVTKWKIFQSDSSFLTSMARNSHNLKMALTRREKNRQRFEKG